MLPAPTVAQLRQVYAYYDRAHYVDENPELCLQALLTVINERVASKDVATLLGTLQMATGKSTLERIKAGGLPNV